MQPQPIATVRDAVDGRIPTDDRQIEIERQPRSSYHDRRRWATPTRRRTDVYVVDLSRPALPPVDDEVLALTA
jgi:hypothetical protein